MNEIFVCKGGKLAAFLLRNNCTCFKVDLDRDNTNYVVFLFEKDIKCKLALNKWENENLK